MGSQNVNINDTPIVFNSVNINLIKQGK